MLAPRVLRGREEGLLGSRHGVLPEGGRGEGLTRPALPGAQPAREQPELLATLGRAAWARRWLAARIDEIFLPENRAPRNGLAAYLEH